MSIKATSLNCSSVPNNSLEKTRDLILYQYLRDTVSDKKLDLKISCINLSKEWPYEINDTAPLWLQNHGTLKKGSTLLGPKKYKRLSQVTFKKGLLDM